MSRAYEIYVVVGDIGSAKDLVSAGEELAEYGHLIKWIADPKGKAASDVLTKKGIIFESRSSPIATDRPEIILIGTSASAVEAQIAWTQYGHEKSIPVIWYEDLWGTGEREATIGVNPDIMLVIDETAEKIAKTVRPNLKTKVVGKPTYEQLNNFIAKTPEIRRKIHDELKVRPLNFLVSYWSSGEDPSRAKTHLNILKELSAIDGHQIILAPRLHPKLAEDIKKELWDICRSGQCIVVDAQSVPQEELIIASDAVIADWSGDAGYKSILLNVPVLITLFPDDTEKRVKCGYPDGDPPHVASGAVPPAYCGTDISEFLQTCIVFDNLDSTAFHRALQKLYEPHLDLLKPGSVKRICQAVEECLFSLAE